MEELSTIWKYTVVIGINTGGESDGIICVWNCNGANCRDIFASWSGSRHGSSFIDVIWHNNGSSSSSRYYCDVIKQRRHNDDDDHSTADENKHNHKEQQQLSPWSDLPTCLLGSIFSRLSMLESVMFRSTCKSWNNSARFYSPTTSYPLLMVSDRMDAVTRHFLGVKDRMQFIIRLDRSVCLGCHYGWLVMVQRNLSKISLLNPFSGNRFHLPPWRCHEHLQGITMSSPPQSNSCVVLAITRNYVLYCLPSRDHTWTTIEFELYEDDGTQVLLQSTVTASNGKFYVLSDELSLIDIELSYHHSSSSDDKIGMTLMGIPCINPFSLAPAMVSNTPHLVTCPDNGNIWLVLEICNNEVHKTDDIKVFELDATTMEWVEKRSLDGQVLFLGSHCSVMVAKVEIGTKGDHIYFTERSMTAWRVFDMETRSFVSGPRLYMGSIVNAPPRIWIQPCWAE